jgi:hypothetical protein
MATASNALAMGRNTNAFVPNMVDEEPALYWDTLLTASGTILSAQYNTFSIPIGTPNPFNGNVPNTKLQTNMQKANEFPPPRCLLLKAIQFQFSSQMVKADIDKVMDGAYIEFKISDKIFFEGMFADFPGAGGLMGVTTNNGESVYTNGFPAPQASRRYGSWAKYIPPLTRFTLNVFFNGSNTGGTIPTLTGPVGLYMRVVLDGISALPVQ